MAREVLRSANSPRRLLGRAEREPSASWRAPRSEDSRSSSPLLVAEGEPRGHGVFHLIFGVVALVLFFALDRWWRPREGTASLRVPLMLLLWLALAGAFLESIGAAGYDRLNSGQRIAWLTLLHNALAPLGALTLLVMPIALIVLGSAIVGRIRR
jgi:hypothetical protein